MRKAVEKVGSKTKTAQTKSKQAAAKSATANKPVSTEVKAGKSRAPRKIRSKKTINSLLIAAAREEFQSSGYFGATTASIARRAEVTETQLFRHFPTKADLFRAAVFDPLLEHFASFHARNPTLPAKDVGDRERARLYVGELQGFLDEHSKLLLSLIVAQIFQVGDLKHLDSMESLDDYFRQGAELMGHRVGEHADLDPKLLVRISFAGLMGCVLFKDWFVPEGMASDEAVNRSIANFMLDGIGLEKQPSSPPSHSAVAKTQSVGAPKSKKEVKK